MYAVTLFAISNHYYYTLSELAAEKVATQPAKSSGRTSNVGVPRKRKSVASISGGATPETNESGADGAAFCKDDIYAFIAKLSDSVSTMNKTLKSLKAKVDTM